MATLCELAAEIVKAHASTNKMTTGELLQEIQKVYATLEALETGRPPEVVPVEAVKPATVRHAIRKDK